MQRIDSLTDVPELSDLFVPRSTNFHNFTTAGQYSVVFGATLNIHISTC